MANIATGEFAAACSNAGALGIIGAGGMDADTLRENIRRCKQLTTKPFGVNIMLMHPQADEFAKIVVAGGHHWRGNPASMFPCGKPPASRSFLRWRPPCWQSIWSRWASTPSLPRAPSGGHGRNDHHGAGAAGSGRGERARCGVGGIADGCQLVAALVLAPAAYRRAPACWASEKAPSMRTIKPPCSSAGRQ